MVIGANGQDGTFLVRHLLSRNYEVMGLGRQAESGGGADSALFCYRQVDLREDRALAAALQEFSPDLVFHVAAVHASAGGSYERVFGDMLRVNTGSVHTVLEYMRERPEARLIYASSAKVFGDPLPARIDETTPKISSCLYSITKNASRELIQYYRKLHGVKASVVFLFNHESELRQEHFFIPKILHCLASSLRDPAHVAYVNTLDFVCDWGSAEEYMSIVIDMLEKAPSEDFVLATGNCIHARDLVEELFARYGLDYATHLQPILPQEQPTNSYSVDIGKVRLMIGRVPFVPIEELCIEIMEKNFRV
jgi:GDPmannose 4,6-dehydratase